MSANTSPPASQEAKAPDTVETTDPEKVSQDDPEPGAPVQNDLTRSSTLVQRLRRRMTKRKTDEDAWQLPEEQHRHPSDYPRGYPRLAAYVNSESNTHIYRRFGYLRNRSLLYTQDELVCLERKLKTMDEADFHDEPYRLIERTFDVEEDPKRQQLFLQINAKLKEYDEMIMREKEMLALQRPSNRDWLYYARYLWLSKPVSLEDMEFVWLKDDMIDLYTHSESTWMRPMVETVVSMVPQKMLMFLFRKRRKAGNAGGDDQNAESSELDHTTESLVDDRLELVFKIIVVLITVILLLVPVALLYLLNVSAWWKLIIVFIFIALFTTVTLFMTQAKRNEVFVSVATYTAVLVVFLGNLPSPTS